MKFKLRKIDAVIVVILIIISVLVLFRAKFIEPPTVPEPPEIHFQQDDVNKKLIVTYVSDEVRWDELEISGDCDKSKLGMMVVEGNEIADCSGTIIVNHKETGATLGSWVFTKKEKLPESLTLLASQRKVSPEDEGAHYKDKLLVNREWWYYTVIFDKNSELAGWTATISFNHMARNDLFITKPDLLFVILHSPDGREYGGVIEKERPLLGDYSFLKEPVLQTSSSEKMFKVSFEDSYVQGLAPNWFLHIEGKMGGKDNIQMDLTFEAKSSPYWTYSNRPIDKSNGKIASYIFLGCDVEGSVNIEGIDYNVKGIGHHEHTWASGILTSGIIRGWDWCQITLENGWNIYYNNYYFTSQYKRAKTYNSNPFSNIIITTDQGEKLLLLNDIKVDITDSDKIFLLLNLPNKIDITAEPSISQILVSEYDVKLDLSIDSHNTFDKEWKKLTHVGMRIGRANINGIITWNDDEGDHEVELNGVGTIWNMRR